MHTLLFLNPAHFHAALTLRERHALVNEEIFVYATPGPELDAFLALVKAFNVRPRRPTRWRCKVNAGAEPLRKLIAEGRGDVAVLTGRNRTKMADIRRLREAGFHVLADKPWLTGPEGLPHLMAATAGTGPLVMDIMTSRYEVAAIVQRKLLATPDVFGDLVRDPAGEPAIFMDSVHHLYKTVNGVPLVRPAWYFDIRIQGDGVVDVPTHLVDLAQWTTGGPPVDYDRDVELLAARRWATPVPPEQFTRITEEGAYPGELAPWVRGGTLHYLCNGEFSYRLRGIPIRVRSVWDLEAPPGGGDASCAVLRGTRADVVLEQGPHTGFEARLCIQPRAGANEVTAALEQAVACWQGELPGLSVAPDGERLHLKVPSALRSSHEEHFARVLDEFLGYLERGAWPPQLAPNLRGKYTLLARASQLARQGE